jgi:signal transduction histidine kinase
VWGTNLNIIHKIVYLLQSKITVRLWAIMMGLIIFMLAFLWGVQFFLFEENYVNSTVETVQLRLKPLVDELKTKDLKTDEDLIITLSKATNSKMMLMDAEGEIVAMYSQGHKLMDSSSFDSMSWLLPYLRASESFQKVYEGIAYNRVIRNEDSPIALEIGIPVLYNGDACAVILYHTMDELHTVLQLNRYYLSILTVILIVVAAVISAILSKHFVRPIHKIKGTVDELAKGNLSAKPDVELKDELGQLSNAVRDLGTALQRVDVLRKEVIANVSHELRSPLSLIRGYAEMLRDLHGEDPEKREEDLTLIINESTRMSTMVNDILDYSQIQAGYIQLKKIEVNLVEFIQTELTHFDKIAETYAVTIELKAPDEPIRTQVDVLKMGQVIGNLMNNAINHTEDYGVVKVEITASEQTARVSIGNPGTPIPDEMKDVIWERFQRAQHAGSRKSGTGLGLSIVKTLLEAHQMAYGVDSADGWNYFWFECQLSIRTRA